MKKKQGQRDMMIIYKNSFLIFFLLLLNKQEVEAQQYKIPEITQPEYVEIQKDLKQGWNTWRNHSMTSHVLLPENLCINIGVKDKGLFGEFYRFFYPAEDEGYIIRPGKIRSLDGTYTELTIQIKEIELEVQSAAYNGNQYILIEPRKLSKLISPDLVVEVANIWGGSSIVQLDIENQKISASSNTKEVPIHFSEPVYRDHNLESFANHLSITLKEEGTYVAIYTGEKMEVEEVKSIIEENKSKVLDELAAFGKNSEVAQMHYAMLGWSTIYEPEYDRVVTPGAGRWWNKRFQGYALWGWDFTAYNFLPFDKNLAYVNLIEIFRHATPEGFFPNYYMGYDRTSRDRSQPPVYSFAVRELYKKYQDLWFVELSFDYLLKNNKWWFEKRQKDGFLCWGSDNLKYDWDANTKQAAMFESGLDNSPMFDSAIYNPESGLLEQADVGLMSFYILDCEALIQLAKLIGNKKAAKEINKRKEAITGKLQNLWNEEEGVFLNMYLDAKKYGRFNMSVSPTNLYPLFTDVVSTGQVDRIVKDYFYNKDKFFGEYMLPSITRDSPTYQDQSYWRGRIWPPMNLLVYLGLKRHGKEEEAKLLVEKSTNLVMTSYQETNWIRENYHGDLGNGTPCTNNCFGGSDIYYTWGSVFGIPQLLEEGFYPPFFKLDQKLQE